MLRTLSARFTFSFTLLFSFLALLVFLTAYFSLKSNLVRQIDAELHEDGLDFLHIYQQQGFASLEQDLDLEVQAESEKTLFFRLFSAGKLVAHSDLSSWSGIPAQAAPPAAEPGQLFYSITLPGQSDPVRLFSQFLDEHTVLQMGYKMSAEQQLLQSLLIIFCATFLVMVLSGALFGSLIARRSLAGIERVRQSAERISSGDLTARIPADGGSKEIHNLSQSFNRMQERIQALIAELSDVTNNVAHDLRSPLTRMRGLAETTLTGEQQLEEYQEMAAVVIEESDRLVGMINTMLEIAETDAGVLPPASEQVNMAVLAEDVVELYSAVAEDKRQKLSCEIGAPQLLITGDRARLQRALANLLDNAIKFTPEGGRISLSAQAEEPQVVIRISDTGPGIPASALPQVCDRFFRGEQSRTTPGSGLGLSLVQAIVRAHGGEIQISSQTDQGAQVSLYLPAFK